MIRVPLTALVVLAVEIVVRAIGAWDAWTYRDDA